MIRSELGDDPAAKGPGSGAGSPVDAAEAELVRRARRGDRAAFADLYDDYASMVHGILISMVTAQDAKDLVQDVFLSALRAIEGLERDDRFGPWVATIARNRAKDAYKSRTPEVGLDEVLDPAAPETHAEQPAGEDEEAERVFAVVRDLPEAYRETLCLRLVEGLTGPEIATRTGLTHGSVRVNLHRGMKLLRERLDGLGMRGEIA
jgi:RNA polymerase sigma-70 factor (ECF subfamily)